MATIPHLACMLAVAAYYGLPPRVLPAIQAVEGGQVGTASRNTDGSEDLGVMQVNTRWLGPIAQLTGLPEATVRERLTGVWGAVERKSYVRVGSSASSPAEAGSRSGRSSPRATGSGRVKA